MMHIELVDLPSIFRRIWMNVGILLGATGIALLLGFATVALNARALGPEGLGIISLFQSSAAVMTGLFSIGSQQPMIRLGRQAIEEGRKDRVGIIAGLAIMLDTLAAIGAGLCALALIWLVPGPIGLSEEIRRIALIYTIVIFFSGNAASSGILRLLNQFHYIGALQVTNALLTFAASLLLFLDGAAVRTYVVTYAVIQSTTAVAHVLLALLLLRGNGVPVRFCPQAIGKAGILPEYFSYAWTTGATSTLDIFRRNTDAIFLGVFFGPTIVGIYSVVKQLAGVFNKVQIPLSSAIFPEVVALAANDARIEARKLLNRLTVGGLAIGGGGILAMAVGGGMFLEFGFGEQFNEGYCALVVMMCGVTLTLSSASFGGFVQVFCSPRKLLVVYVGASLTYFFMAPPLIYFMGILGAVIGQIAFAIVFWFGCWKAIIPKLV